MRRLLICLASLGLAGCFTIGGAQSWDPGPLPAEMDGDNYRRQVWTMVKG